MFVRNQTTAAAVIAHRIRNRSAPTSKMSAMLWKLTPATVAASAAVSIASIKARFAASLLLNADGMLTVNIRGLVLNDPSVGKYDGSRMGSSADRLLQMTKFKML